MPLRTDSSKIAVHGFYPGAKVTRGLHWEWDDQDGKFSTVSMWFKFYTLLLCFEGGDGNFGEVVELLDYKSQLNKKLYAKSFVKVIWEKKNETNKYRIGYRGQVDLKCCTSASGGYIYKDHLPVIGRVKFNSRLVKLFYKQQFRRTSVFFILGIWFKIQLFYQGW